MIYRRDDAMLSIVLRQLAVNTQSQLNLLSYIIRTDSFEEKIGKQIT